MKITIDLEELSVNEKAEHLRDLVFKQRLGKRFLRGCYSTFEVQDGFVKIDPQKSYPELFKEFEGYLENGINIYAYENKDIVAIWAWDGDGTLLLYVKWEDSYLISEDCKKDYEWVKVKIDEPKHKPVTSKKHQKIIANRAGCRKCGSVIESKFRHNFVQCKCGEIFVDGGTDYCRSGAKDLANFIPMYELEEE